MSQQTICPTCQTSFESAHEGGMCPKCLLMGAQPRQAGRNDAQYGGATQTFESPLPNEMVMKPGKVNELFPEFEVLDVVGHGGMGVVYKARQKNLGRVVALKLLSGNLRDNPSFAERFTREARAMAMMNHPNIISIYDFGQRGDHYFLSMEYVDGLNLRQLIDGTRIEPAEAMQMVPQLCDALQYAHDMGVVHRDIKPENVLVSQDGYLKIADFGLAKLIDGSPGNITLTQSRQVMGTLNYMAPEQVERPTDVDHRADIYSLGVVIYELLTGELPLGRFSVPSAKAEIDARLDDVVLRALEKDPSLRYQQVSEFKTGVQGVAAGKPGPIVRQFGGSEKEQMLASRIGRFIWLALGTTLIFGGAGLLALGAIMDTEKMLWGSGFLALAVGTLLFALFGVFYFVFGERKVREPRDEMHRNEQRAHISSALLIVGICLMAGSLVCTAAFDLPEIVGLCIFGGGVVAIAARPFFGPSASSREEVVDAKLVEPEKPPKPAWLLGLEIIATMFFFACPLCFIGSAFAPDSVDGVLRFMGIATPIIGALLTTVVSTIAKNQGYREE